MNEQGGVNVLVVDDEEFVRRMFHRLLTGEGYSVDMADSGELALNMLGCKNYNVVITDIRMPGLNGVELMKRIREDNPLTEIIVATGYGAEESAVEAVRAHAFDYLSKPLSSPSVLLEAVHGAVQRRHRAEELEYKPRKELVELNRQLDKTNKELKEANNALKAMQSQLLQQEKMAAIGQLAAGVAHEINNPIGFVHSNLGTLKRFVDKIVGYNSQCDELVRLCCENDASGDIKEKAKEVLDSRKNMKLDFIFGDLLNVVTESLEGTERVRKIVADLKSFSHIDEKATPEYADINQGMESTLSIVWNELKYKATVQKEFGQIPLIECYPMQLNQVFMNLLVNAAQAIEEKGEIIIKTFVDGQHLCVEIQDTGMGIPAENIPHLFDPFFTTKPVGKGTGLGLSIAYDIVNKHGGTIGVISKPDKGSTFTIRLPLKGIDA